MKYIEEDWQLYKRKVLDPEGPGEIQVSEMRKAFYAGAWALFTTIQVLSPETEPTRADLDKLTSIDKELRQFVVDLKAGEV